MDVKRHCWVVLLFASYLQPTHADTTVAPAGLPEGETPAATVQPPDVTKPVTAQVWNRSKVPIEVSQKGRSPVSIEPTRGYDSVSYPQAPISIRIPENSLIKYITVTGEHGACTVPVCIYVQ
ncbi:MULTISPECIES: hypothetical protein [Pseudomonas]|jgi:hypothetical protein|uniref:hypothetical protein n=1 Tax=Pseudomonas TaxID=286 RepID=UPI000908D237|nr:MULTISPECIES: hypothetical protein [Pseudomonas]MDB6446897.1 hypothetical protein [Pseudomonas sp. 21TX0197]MDT8908077.1 hypothetical protein [Pseudomonas prosekii]NHN70797.1 hypothetical protein [Pseudomonas fluorescens]ROO40102.1 hypothetical protein BIV08_16270 [Pseudomonas sp. AF76]SFW82938.1 hypothetical protein SAMN03159376_04264 [Pseudomonas sp. NFACC09-4]